MATCPKCGGTPNKFGKCLICEMLGQGEPPGGTQPAGWPKESVALSVHENQAQAANDRAKRHGLTGVQYKPDGTCVIADSGQRRKLMKLEGFHDRKSFL